MPVKIGDVLLYSIAELSQILNVTAIMLRAYCRGGRIGAGKLGNRWYISQRGLEDFFNSSKNQAKKGRGNQTEDDSIESDDPKEHENSEVGQYIVAGIAYCDRCHNEWGDCVHSLGLRNKGG